MKYYGIDLHKKSSEICVMNNHNNHFDYQRIPTSQKQFANFFQNTVSSKIAIEATSSTFFYGRQLERMGHQVYLANPSSFRGIISGGITTDKRASLALCKSLKLGMLPTIYLKTERSQRIFHLLNSREQLIKNRTILINSLRGMLREYGYSIPKGRERFFKAYSQLRLDPELEQIFNPLFETIIGLTEKILNYERTINQLADSIEIVKRWKSQLLGVGALMGLAFYAVIGTPFRFKRGRPISAYLGLTPRLKSSGGKERKGSITKAGNSLLRTFLIHAGRVAVCFAKEENSLIAWARRIKKRRGANKSFVAYGSRLARIMWAMWRYNQDFKAEWIGNSHIYKTAQNS